MQAAIDVVSADDYDKLVSEKERRRRQRLAAEKRPKPAERASNAPVTSAPVAVASAH